VAPVDRETLRIFILLPLLGLFENPRLFSELHCPFSRNLIGLPEAAWKILEKWIAAQKSDYLRPFVSNFKV
jgi:E3 ubiquitin-protein ligase HERC4